MKDPIFIVGAPRSGTSMTAASLIVCGAWGGRGLDRTDLHRCSCENPVIDSLLRRAIKSLGLDPSSHETLPEKALSEPPCHWLNWRVTTDLVQQGLHGNQHWFVKHSRLLWFWPIWARAFPNARWLLVRRSVGDLATSARKTWTMKGWQTQEQWEEWATWYNTRLDEVEEHVQYSQSVWSTRFFQGDFGGLQRFVEDVGMTWNDVGVRKLFGQEVLV